MREKINGWYHNQTVRLVAILLLTLIGSAIFMTWKQKHDELGNVEYVKNLQLESDEKELEVCYDDGEPSDTTDNHIYNSEIFAEHKEVEMPIMVLQRLPKELNDYLNSVGYYGETLYVNESTYHKRGTIISLEAQIGETDSTVYVSYDIRYDSFSFYVKSE